MKRDMNGISRILGKKRAQRLLVDTVTGTILGYTDIYGKTGDARPQVLDAIAHRGIVVLTIDEYLRMTRDDTPSRESKYLSSRIATGQELYEEAERNGLFDKIFGIANIQKQVKSKNIQL
jgi:hypothetical protein